MDKIPAHTVYKVDSSFERVDDLKNAIARAFDQEGSVGLVTYSISIKPTEVDGLDQSRSSHSNGVMLTDARAQQDDVTEETDDADAQTGTSDGSGETTAPLAEIFNSSAMVELGIEGGTGGGASINGVALKEALVEAATEVNVALTDRVIELAPFEQVEQEDGTMVWQVATEWTPKSQLPFSRWQVDMPLPASQADLVMDKIKQKMEAEPVWISSSSVGARVAGDMIGRAFGALFASLLCIIAYIWFRFQRVIYGFAAVAALLHDVLITLGAIAVSYWLADFFGFLLIDPFKISLTVVAAILTIIGYSLNDTIVVFDRIRETKGKAKRLTGEMINSSINQTLSRTLLTSLTTLIVVMLLYWFGGEGIHAFAFALVIGVIAGTYSSVFIASPILLWLLDRQDRPQTA
jgi:SecD/SecF fusion protein